MNARTALVMADNALSLLEDIALEVKHGVAIGAISLEQEQNIKRRAESIFSTANVPPEEAAKPPAAGFPVEPGHPMYNPTYAPAEDPAGQPEPPQQESHSA